MEQKPLMCCRIPIKNVTAKDLILNRVTVGQHQGQSVPLQDEWVRHWMRNNCVMCMYVCKCRDAGQRTSVWLLWDSFGQSGQLWEEWVSVMGRQAKCINIFRERDIERQADTGTSTTTIKATRDRDQTPEWVSQWVCEFVCELKCGLCVCDQRWSPARQKESTFVCNMR